VRFATSSGFYELNPFPGCNQIVVSNHSFIKPHLRGQGKGHYEHQLRLSKMYQMGYDYAICTVVGCNEAQIRILKKNGWTNLDTFQNRETGNTIQIWGRHIP
jgi:hypothetical protein